jgi:hypothetical protein
VREEIKAENPILLVELREEKLREWLKRNRPLLSQTDRVKITINIKGQNVIGEITNFPD